MDDQAIGMVVAELLELKYANTSPGSLMLRSQRQPGFSNKLWQ
ncbi:MAG: hypothetical protein QXR80_01515 [Desulfurococcaceae archaeon]